MEKAQVGRSLLLENTVEPGVFQDMDNFELNDAGKFALSIRLQFPKFSKGFSASDFESFIQDHIGEDNVVSLGRLSYPNEWQMQVNSQDIREKLIRLGRTKINTRSCWISPLSQSEVRGYVHWIPNAVHERVIIDLLNKYGEVLFMENQKDTKWRKVESDSRYFALNLKPGQTMDDIPHFTKINNFTGLITIKGRAPCCFHCRDMGHRKSDCKKYKETLNGYSVRQPHSAQRRKPRGMRYKPIPAATLKASIEENEVQGAIQKSDGKKEPGQGKKRNRKNKAKGDSVPAKDLNVSTEAPTAKNMSSEGDSVPAKVVNVSTEAPKVKNVPLSGGDNILAKKSNVSTVAPTVKRMPSSDGDILKNLDMLTNLSNLLSLTATTWNNHIEVVKQGLLSNDVQKIDVGASNDPVEGVDTANENSIPKDPADVCVELVDTAEENSISNDPVQFCGEIVEDSVKENPITNGDGKKKKKKKKKKKGDSGVQVL